MKTKETCNGCPLIKCEVREICWDDETTTTKRRKRIEEIPTIEA